MTSIVYRNDEKAKDYWVVTANASFNPLLSNNTKKLNKCQLRFSSIPDLIIRLCMNLCPWFIDKAWYMFRFFFNFNFDFESSSVSFVFYMQSFWNNFIFLFPLMFSPFRFMKWLVLALWFRVSDEKWSCQDTWTFTQTMFGILEWQPSLSQRRRSTNNQKRFVFFILIAVFSFVQDEL